MTGWLGLPKYDSGAGGGGNGTTQAVVARLAGGRVTPSTPTLERFAKGIKTPLRIRFEPVGKAAGKASAAVYNTQTLLWLLSNVRVRRNSKILCAFN